MQSGVRAMEVDPVVIAIFGQPPDGIDLGEVFMPTADALVISLACIAGLFVLLRFTARYVQSAGLATDDYLIVLSLVFAIVTCAIVVQSNAAGSGKHVWAVTSEQVVQASKWMLLLGIFCSMSIGATKSSILLLYVRIFGLSNRAFKVLVYVGAFLSVGCALATSLMLVATCRPTSYFWTQFGPDAVRGSCGNTGASIFAVGVINLFLDFYLLAIPIPQILGLNMPRRKKIVLCGLILIGVFVGAAGVFRNYYLVRFNVAIEPDYTWNMQPSDIWLCVEATLGIVCACLSNVYPLYLWLQQRIRSMVCGGGVREAGEGSEGRKAADRNRLPSYIEAKLVLRPQGEDEIRLTTLATTGGERDSGDSVHHADGIVVRSEFTQVIHEAEQR